MKKNLLTAVVIILVNVSGEYSFADGHQVRATKTVTHQKVTTRSTAAPGSSQHHQNEKAPGSNHTSPNGASMHHATEAEHLHTVTTVEVISRTDHKNKTNPAQRSSLEFHELDLLKKLSAKAKEGKKLSLPDRKELFDLTHRSEGEDAAKKVIQEYHLNRQNRLKSKSSAEETHEQNTQDVQAVHLTNKITKPEENKSETQVATPPVSTAKIETDAKEKKDPPTLEDKKSASGGTNHTAVAAGLAAGEGAALAIKGVSEGAKQGAAAARQTSKAIAPEVEKAAEQGGKAVGRGIVSAGKVTARAAKVSAQAAYRGAKVAAPIIGKGLYLGAKGGATLGAAAVTGTGLAIYHGAKATAKFVGGVAKGASRALKSGGKDKPNGSSAIVPYRAGATSGGYPSFSGANSSSAIIPYQGSTSQSGIGASGSQNNPPRSISSGASGSSSSSNDWQKLGLSAAPSSATPA